MDGDTLAGLDYDLLKMLGIPFRIYPITSPAEGLQGLDEGRFDMVIADLPQSADLSDRYLLLCPPILTGRYWCRRPTASEPNRR